MIQDTHLWAESVFGECRLPDLRLQRRLILTATQFALDPGASVNAACKGDPAVQEGAYRLLENDRVSASSIAEGGFVSTVSVCDSIDEDLLLVMDTTTLSFSHSVRDELGPVGYSSTNGPRGWQVHSGLMLSGSNGFTLGLIDQEWWQRDPESHGKSQRRRQRSYQDKESFKWESCLSRSAERLGAQMSRVVTVCDREADLYEFLAYNELHGYRYVVRACYDRALSDEDTKLFDHVRSQDALGQTEVTVQQRGGRVARVATVTLRSSRVTLRPPRGKRKAYSPLTLWVLHIEEESPPDGVKPLIWRLLTTEPVATIEDALKVQGYYTFRWRVEEYHKAWKSGCGLHETRMQYSDNLQRLVQILAFVGVRLLQLKEWKETEARCEQLLKPEEWKLLWLSTMKNEPLPEKPPSMKWAYYTIAKMGGWIDTKRNGRVGWKAMWKGYDILQERLAGWELARKKM